MTDMPRLRYAKRLRFAKTLKYAKTEICQNTGDMPRLRYAKTLRYTNTWKTDDGVKQVPKLRCFLLFAMPPEVSKLPR